MLCRPTVPIDLEMEVETNNFVLPHINNSRKHNIPIIPIIGNYYTDAYKRKILNSTKYFSVQPTIPVCISAMQF